MLAMALTARAAAQIGRDIDPQPRRRPNARAGGRAGGTAKKATSIRIRSESRRQDTQSPHPRARASPSLAHAFT
eukprot:11161907-Lingulodinium_polyedra.AAC.1